ncbi:MAG TPA: hypothetical protein PKY59_22010 [Pyrinomonadaceae bacterium]|nr:hypothetical protein [Pyrinomonadaceae bacterium]
MKRFGKIFNLSLILVSAFNLTAFANSSEKNKKDVATPSYAVKDYSAITKDLSQKLKSDLSENDLTVKIKMVEEAQVTTREVVVKGEAICILPTENTQLPLQFEAKLNKSNNSFEDVKYVFVESEYAPSSGEEILMKELMKQISSDYKTDQITIAIDTFEATQINEDQKSVKGFGEVRVGNLVWNKITFDVVMKNDDTASKVDYKIEKQ